MNYVSNYIAVAEGVLFEVDASKSVHLLTNQSFMLPSLRIMDYRMAESNRW